MHRSVLISLLVLATAVVALGLGGPIGATTVGEGVSSPAATTVGENETVVEPDEFDSVSPQDFDSTTFEITVYENGSAEWTFRYERLLSDSDEEDRFELFAQTFEEEELEFYQDFEESAHALTEVGAEETGREMEPTNFDRSAGIDQRFNTKGIVEMSFLWTAFAPVEEDGTVVVSDVFNTGRYIMSDQTLRIQTGDNLAFVNVEPDGEYTGQSITTSNSVSWSGEREFIAGQPRVVLEPTGTSQSGANESGPFDVSRLLIGAVVLTAGLGLGGAFVWYRYRTAHPSPETPAARSETSATEGSTDGSRPEPEPIPEDELLTDEDRVVKLIQENGGRMKQVNIVEETGWSKSKVSMLLSDMEDEGAISKLRVGRENIISLKGFEPEATKSPFDE